MLGFGVLITIIGMLAVFTFLFVLMQAVRLMSFAVSRLEKKDADNDKIAALIAIALQGGSK